MFLKRRNGKPKYNDPSDRRVLFASPLIDIAANLAAMRQTVAACRMILEHTHWQIRLLSKSALLRTVAEELKDFKGRVIYGLSTGTFQDDLARSFELKASSPSARLRTLHWLQDNGYRTYAMLCPILPQRDYAAYATQAIEKTRAEKCEHVWAEVLNVRGKSLTKTCAGLRQGGFTAEADSLAVVSGPKHKAEWEAYARATFLSLAKVVPAEKLRFLQYVQPGQLAWWQEQQHLGAVLLGAHAQTGRKGAAQS